MTGAEIRILEGLADLLEQAVDYIDRQLELEADAWQLGQLLEQARAGHPDDLQAYLVGLADISGKHGRELARRSALMLAAWPSAWSTTGEPCKCCERGAAVNHHQLCRPCWAELAA